MNKRQEAAHRVWLRGFGGEGTPPVALPAEVTDSQAMLLHTLGSRFRYIVQLRQDKDTYFVQLLHGGEKAPLGLPPVCISYSGTDLRSILAAALLDASRLMNPDNVWTFSTREVVRWVPS